jgi:ribosomal protein S1
MITARIISLDRQRQRMGLSLKQPEEIAKMLAEQAAKNEAVEETTQE